MIQYKKVNSPNSAHSSRPRWPGYMAAGLIGTLVGGVAAWYAATQLKEEECEHQSKPSTSSYTDAPTRSVRREELLCVVCLTNEREIILLPCGHVCICKTCSGSMQTKLCPICRKTIESRKVAFIS